jgi:uncharacterized protein (DUF488 family)
MDGYTTFFNRLELLAHLSMTTPYLYTCGYEGHDINAFIARLIQAGVNTIVDVRELPLSRKKGFSKNALREQLAAVGIDYVHASPLGCPKVIRNRYREDGDWQQYTREFMLYLKQQGEPLRELAKLAKSSATCLICYEADYTTCHRTYVARAAHLAGAPVVKHLTAKTDFLDRALRVAV